ncbi:SDR family NAD(P)-dependent oxidoreductase [Mucilaginibacter jinjuensis]|uniref:SDR family NAD(P)-dependent oxidoreductase n=1 Tax=Mucilaginibacter jinjuensis TaxID=1176721 RepID=A0ABY7T309_9SPHI|nr:SDR family NAD(P)-dependent oxidoreductase [Mucilaginibacter jinjuensis]WCT10653.1 SDR family NAD(P)-dependent oxidoreductase [Mucilaginibacter jinjuensis]
MSKIIFITGASRGFGKLWAEALLQRGDKVVATARDLSTLNSLAAKYGDNILPLKLDVNDRVAGFKAIARAKEHFGRIDVLINNAGYGLFGAIEETTEKEARDQMETNFFGLLWLSQAVLPIMREQGHGHIIQLSSVLGLISRPVLGLYAASKFAVEGLSESLAAEMKGFGINVSIIEPAGFDTEWGSSSAARTVAMAEYNDVKANHQAGIPPDFRGDANGTIDAVLKLIDSENPPLRLLLGKYANMLVKKEYVGRNTEWDSWLETTLAAQGK